MQEELPVEKYVEQVLKEYGIIWTYYPLSDYYKRIHEHCIDLFDEGKLEIVKVAPEEAFCFARLQRESKNGLAWSSQDERN